MNRRHALLLPLLLAACGDDEPSSRGRANFPPLRYAYLPPINLNVQRVEITGDFVPPVGEDQVGDPSMAETLHAMARDRLKPVATSGVATFRILTASVTRRRDSLNGVMVVRVDVHDAEDTNSGFAEARVTATRSGSIADIRGTAYDILKSMMDDMNVELEYQLRNKLRGWVVEPPAESPPAQPPSNAATVPATPAEPLPPPPPAPPRP